mmetsp:Transcript_6336/g.17770  ORF Transcript_6336/g.17770 Transcript_6336/m.17770 type:complete len:296 (+) Transcript_6336:684-1571(+)
MYRLAHASKQSTTFAPAAYSSASPESLSSLLSRFLSSFWSTSSRWAEVPPASCSCFMSSRRNSACTRWRSEPLACESTTICTRICTAASSWSAEMPNSLDILSVSARQWSGLASSSAATPASAFLAMSSSSMPSRLPASTSKSFVRDSAVKICSTRRRMSAMPLMSSLVAASPSALEIQAWSVCRNASLQSLQKRPSWDRTASSCSGDSGRRNTPLESAAADTTASTTVLASSRVDSAFSTIFESTATVVSETTPRSFWRSASPFLLASSASSAMRRKNAGLLMAFAFWPTTCGS